MVGEQKAKSQAHSLLGHAGVFCHRHKISQCLVVITFRRMSNHLEAGQITQSKRVYLYRSALGAKIILDECIGLIAPIEREAGPIEPNKNSPRRNSVP